MLRVRNTTGVVSIEWAVIDHPYGTLASPTSPKAQSLLFKCNFSGSRSTRRSSNPNRDLSHHRYYIIPNRQMRSWQSVCVHAQPFLISWPDLIHELFNLPIGHKRRLMNRSQHFPESQRLPCLDIVKAHSINGTASRSILRFMMICCIYSKDSVQSFMFVQVPVVDFAGHRSYQSIGMKFMRKISLVARVQCLNLQDLFETLCSEKSRIALEPLTHVGCRTLGLWIIPFFDQSLHRGSRQNVARGARVEDRFHFPFQCMTSV
mmetsp:Transcript_31247/g.75553  ORF Transcript_31247/g.75553 Transcript_31247/m.75553 type:complete len:262 (+) Transcript_31247:801-1586(+)